MPTQQKWCLRHFSTSTRKAIREAFFCQGGILAIQTCLIDQIVALMSIITVKIIYTNQFKLSSFYFIEFKEKSKKSKNRPKSTKSRKLKILDSSIPSKITKSPQKIFVLEGSKSTPGLKRSTPHKLPHWKEEGKSPNLKYTHNRWSASYIICVQRWYWMSERLN